MFELITGLLLDKSTEIVLSENSNKSLLEGLLSHYFSPYLCEYNQEDVEWFFNQANKQVHWKVSLQSETVKESNKGNFEDQGLVTKDHARNLHREREV